jgi:D-alanyl-D-alanine carboxypeptidase
VASDRPSRGSRRWIAAAGRIALLGSGLALLVAGIAPTIGGSAALPIPSGAAVAAAGPSASPAPAASPTPTPAPTPIPAYALQVRLNAIRVQYHVPGVSVTIMWPDGRSWTGVNGWANVKGHVPVTPKTAFSVGSISKTFLSALIVELADEGRLALDDPVVRWLPTARVPATVTIRELLDHTSGLYDFFSNPTIDAAILADKRRVWTPARALGYMEAPYCSPGTCWHYSNSNYVLLGQIAQRVTGDSVATELRRRFFDPFRLAWTFVQGVEPARGTVATSYQVLGWGTSIRTVSQSDGTAISPFTSVVTAAGSAGAIAATSRDLALWARRLYGGAVLPPDALTTMLDDTQSLRAGSRLPYGLAVEEIFLGGRLTFGHDGRLIGAGASMRYLPESGFSIAVVTNQDRVSPDVFAAALLAIAFPPPPPPPPPTPLPTPTASPSPTPSPTQ